MKGNIPILKGTKLVKEEFLDKHRKTKIRMYLCVIKNVKSMKELLLKEAGYPFYSPKIRSFQQTLVDTKGYLKCGDSEFNHAFNNRQYEGLIYVIECYLPNTWFDGKIYIGITSRSLEIRFKEHLEAAIRECVRTNNNPEPGYTKLYQAIANSLIFVGWDLETVYDNLRILLGKSYYSFLHKLKNSIKDTYIIPRIIEIHDYIDTIHDREKYYTKKFNTVDNGLNEYEGGGYRGKHISLPIYDIALMIAFGKNLHQIARILSKLYNFDVSKETIARRILNFFGGWYEAQVKFLKPIIESLFLEGFKGHDVYRVFEESSGQHQCTWFNDWRWGETYLEIDILKAHKKLEDEGFKDWDNTDLLYGQIDKRYFGIQQSQWIKWAVEGVSRRKIEKVLGFSAKTITKIYRNIGGSHEAVQLKNRRLKAIKLMKNHAWSLEKIYIDAFMGAQNSPPKRIRSLAKQYFEQKIFPDMTIDEIYRKYLWDFGKEKKFINL